MDICCTANNEARYRSALLWVFDRLTIDGGMMTREQRYTFEQIGNVLMGKPSPADSYQPKEWAASTKIKA